MNTAIHNLCLAARSLRRWGGIGAVALAILALGLGLSIAVFTVADAFLLRPLPVRDQARLVVLWGEAPDRLWEFGPEAHPERQERRG